MGVRDSLTSIWAEFRRRQRAAVTAIEEFERTARRSERLAKQVQPPQPVTEFEQIVAAALDELPEEFQIALTDLPVVVTGGGAERRAYGMYEGDTIARDGWADRILIFEDTLVRDFGHNPDRLRAEIVRTVRHEIAHHLGWDEQGVAGLGL